MLCASRARRSIYLLPGRAAGAGAGGPLAALRVARRHLSLLAAAILLLLAAGTWLDGFSLLLSPAGIIQGATYADVTAQLPALRLLGVAAAVGAVLALAQAFTRRAWLALGGFVLYGATWAGGSIFATAFQRLVVTPNEQVKETPYIAHNIAATRKAFALDNVEERELSGDALLTKADIERERRDDRQRPALGSPAAARHVRADPGDPHVLRLHVGRQRPLRDQRPVPPGDAVGPRAELGEPADRSRGSTSTSRSRTATA